MPLQDLPVSEMEAFGAVAAAAGATLRVTAVQVGRRTCSCMHVGMHASGCAPAYLFAWVLRAAVLGGTWGRCWHRTRTALQWKLGGLRVQHVDRCIEQAGAWCMLQ